MSRVFVSFLPPISYRCRWISDSLLVLRLKIPPVKNKGTKKRTFGRFGVPEAPLLAVNVFWHVNVLSANRYRCASLDDGDTFLETVEQNVSVQGESSSLCWLTKSKQLCWGIPS